jgi:sugar porter (SP) family MFS transporter
MASITDPKIDWKGVCLIFLTPALGGKFSLNLEEFSRLLRTDGLISLPIDFFFSHEGFLYGFDIGATSFVLNMLLHGDKHAHYWWSASFRHSTVQQGLMIAAVSLGALTGSHLVLSQESHWNLGRRMELRFAAALYLLGTSLNVASGQTALQYAGTAGWATLFLGRIIFGLGVGFVMHAAPIYMAEMSPKTIRGAIVSAKETVIVLGIAVGYWTGDLFETNNLYWTGLYGVAVCLLALPMLVLTFCIPRSKRWLLMHGFREEAEQSMRFIYSGDITEEFDRLANSLDASIRKEDAQQQATLLASTNDETCRGWWDSTARLLCSESIRPALRVALGLITLQQFSGQPSVLSYAAVLLGAAGWNGHATVVTALVMLCVSTTTVLTVDHWGRKRLLLTCAAVLCIAALTLAVTFWNSRKDISEPLGPVGKTVVLISMFGYVGGYQIGFGPINWLIVSEVFPGNVRGAATALAVELNYLLNFVVQFAVPVLQGWTGWGPTFGLFAATMAFGLFFIYEWVPETKGLTLEEIGEQLQDGRDVVEDVDTVETEHSPLLQIQ